MTGTAVDDVDIVVAPASARRQQRTWRRLVRRPRFLIPAGMLLVLVAMAVVPSAFAGWFGHGDPRACDLINSARPPASGHPFGFDIQGCDLYANVVYGTRNSLAIGVLVTAGALLAAIALGTVAGYFGGLIDAVISRVMDIFFGFPALVGMIVVLQVLGDHSVWSVSLVLMLFVWPSYARVMRGSVLSVARLEYVQAARSIGSGNARIILDHVIPNAVMPVVVLGTLGVAGTIAAEAALTFLGVGLKAPSISWGVQLNVAQRYFATDPHLLIFPSLLLAVTVLTLILLGDAVRDAVDPQQRGLGR
ncbi:MAG: ABC transporter permease [Nocardioides sp.]